MPLFNLLSAVCFAIITWQVVYEFWSVNPVLTFVAALVCGNRVIEDLNKAMRHFLNQKGRT